MGENLKNAEKTGVNGNKSNFISLKNLYISEFNPIRLIKDRKEKKANSSGAINKKSEEKKSNTMKLKDIVLKGMSGTVGATIYVVLGLAFNIAGGSVIISLMLLAVLVVFLVLNYSELSLSLPILGGGYSFSKEAIGGFWGFLLGWIMWLGNVAFAGLSSMGFAYSFAIFFPDRTGVEENFIPLIAFITVIIFFFLNYYYKEFTNKMMSFFSRLIIISFIIFIIVGFSMGPFTNNTNFDPDNLTYNINLISILRVSPLIIGIFCIYEWNSSFDSVTEEFDKIKKPKESLPKGFVISVSAAALMYIGLAIVTLINMGDPSSENFDLISHSLNPIADVMFLIAGYFGLYFFAFVSMVGNLTSFQAAMRMSYVILYAMSRDGYISKKISKKKENKNELPYIAFILSNTLIAIFVLMFSLKFLLDFTNFNMLLTMSIISLSVILLRTRRENLIRPFKTPGYPYVPIVTSLISFLLVFALATVGFLIGMAALMFGALIYSLHIAKRERPHFLLSGTKAGSSFLLILFMIVINGSVQQNTNIPWLLFFFNPVVIYIICTISLISIYFDFNPLRTLLIKRNQSMGDSARIVSNIIELDDKSKLINTIFNIFTNSFLIASAIYLFGLSSLCYNNIIIFDKGLEFLTASSASILGALIFLVSGIFLIINGIHGLYNQYESSKAIL